MCENCSCCLCEEKWWNIWKQKRKKRKKVSNREKEIREWVMRKRQKRVCDDWIRTDNASRSWSVDWASWAHKTITHYKEEQKMLKQNCTVFNFLPYANPIPKTSISIQCFLSLSHKLNPISIFIIPIKGYSFYAIIIYSIFLIYSEIHCL